MTPDSKTPKGEGVGQTLKVLDLFSGIGSVSVRWQSEPNVGRVAHGVPARLDGVHGLGNAVVPAIPQALGRAILQARAA